MGLESGRHSDSRGWKVGIRQWAPRLQGSVGPARARVQRGGRHQFARASPHASRPGNMHRQACRPRCASFLQRAPISHPSPLQPASACSACSRVSVCTPVSPLLTFVYYEEARKRLPVTFLPLLHNKHELFPFVHAWLSAKTSAKRSVVFMKNLFTRS